MKFSKLVPVFAGALLLAACDRGPTQPSMTEQELTSYDPTTLTFNATNGLPATAMPDSIRLTDAQRKQIQALRAAFDTVRKTDRAMLQTIHDQAMAAVQAGKSRAEVRAILDQGRAKFAEFRTALAQLQAAIDAILTPAQRAWLAAHRPTPPAMHGP